MNIDKEIEFLQLKLEIYQEVYDTILFNDVEILSNKLNEIRSNLEILYKIQNKGEN